MSNSILRLSHCLVYDPVQDSVQWVAVSRRARLISSFPHMEEIDSDHSQFEQMKERAGPEPQVFYTSEGVADARNKGEND